MIEDCAISIVGCDRVAHGMFYEWQWFYCLTMAEKYGWPPKFYFEDGSFNDELPRTRVWSDDREQSVKNEDARALAEAMDRAIAAELHLERVGVMQQLANIARRGGFTVY